MQQAFGFASPATTWVKPSVAKLPSWRDAKRVAIDYETRDEQLVELGPGTRRGAYIVGVSFAIEDGPSHYLPFRHRDHGSNLDEQHVLSYLRDQAACFTGDLCAANAQYEYDMGQAAGVHFRPRRWLDPTVAEPLLDELQLRYGLEHIAQRRNLPGKRNDLLIEACRSFGYDWKHPHKHLWKLDGKYVADYAIQDSRLVLQLLRKQERELEEQDLWGTWELESDILPMLAEVRVRGLRINLDKVAEFKRGALATRAAEMKKFSELCGYECAPEDVNRADALARALQKIGIYPKLTAGKKDKPETRKPQIDKNFFIEHEGVPAVDALKIARRWDDLRQLCEAREKHAVRGPGGEWRIHATFNQLRKEKDDGSEDQKGGRFGRMSACDPNTQQESVREIKTWRSVYEADDGTELWDGDFSQQEPRGWVHYAVLRGLPGAFEFAQRYKKDPATNFHKMTAALTGLEYDYAKNCGLGIGYGMGGGKLCREWLKLPTVWKEGRYGPYEAAGPEGQVIQEKYHAAVPFLKPLAKLCQRIAEQRGYLVLRDADNRRIRFPVEDDGKGGQCFGWVYAALNRLVQGRAAHQTKRAFRAIVRAGCPVQGAVHDQFYWSSACRKSSVEWARVMRDTDKFSTGIPNRVNLKRGPNWCKEYQADVDLDQELAA